MKRPLFLIRSSNKRALDARAFKMPEGKGTSFFLGDSKKPKIDSKNPRNFLLRSYYVLVHYEHPEYGRVVVPFEMKSHDSLGVISKALRPYNEELDGSKLSATPNWIVHEIHVWKSKSDHYKKKKPLSWWKRN